MASIFGNKLRVSIFGQSHSEGIGVTMDGLPSGIQVDMDKLNSFLERRAPGNSDTATSRRESDRPEFLSGLLNGITCGAPLTAIIRNEDVKSQDYDEMKNTPRPGHADYTAHVKYDGNEDYRGGGHFSGRLTAPLCVAGGISIQVLEALGISITSEILEIGGEKINSPEDISRLILAAKEEGDSLGGIVECRISGVPVGVGDPIFDGVENRISQAVFGIPAIKGIEFGAGFNAARMKGSENNDCYYMYNEEIELGSKEGEEKVVKASVIRTKTNNAGGILGGIANGEEIVFRVAVKPTPSIAKEQETVDYDGNETILQVKGRHDPCIVPRVLPCVESAAAIAILDLML